jgi:hypothetical protein
MIKHMRNKTAIRMMTSQKYRYKTKGYYKAWDPTTSITAYLTNLNRFQISLNDCGILTSVKVVAGACMWESEMFTKDQMVTWENKPTTDQTWDHLQIYFKEKWLKRRQYLAAMAKQLHFKRAALAAQQQASAEEEGETQAMIFALLQDQHKLQLEAMAMANKATMDAMMKCMNAILGGGGSRTNKQNKETPPPAANANRVVDKEAKKVKRKKSFAPKQHVCVPQTQQMLRVGSQQGKAMGRLEIKQGGINLTVLDFLIRTHIGKPH